MKKTYIFLILLSTQLWAASAPTEEPGLETQLQKLNMPANQPPAGVDPEKLYSIQNRYSPLKFRHELSWGGAHNFTSDGYLISRNVDLKYRFYWSNRWYTSLSGSYVVNELTTGANVLLSQFGYLPDVAITRYRADLIVGYHLFYGKFRLSMNNVLYFDHYIGVGPGYVSLALGDRYAIVGETGFAFWLGKNFSIRLGMKDYFFSEPRQKKEGFEHNILGSLDFGYVFGG